MDSADITNGRRGHPSQDDPAAQMLSAEQAAPLLGCTVRHVRRLIASGDLAGHKDPYRTWRSALDAYRHRRQPHEGDVVAEHGADIGMSAHGAARAAARSPAWRPRHRCAPQAPLAGPAKLPAARGGEQPLARDEEEDASTAVMVAIAAELAGAREQIERLARENGRLRALLEQRPVQGPDAALPQPTKRRRGQGPLGRLLALLW